MKKLISTLLASALALSLAACSGAGSSSTPAADTPAATAESTQFTGDGFDPNIDYAALAGTTVKVGASPTPRS